MASSQSNPTSTQKTVKTVKTVVLPLPESNHKRSLFMTLPTEIRVQILKEILTTEDGRIDKREEYRAFRPRDFPFTGNKGSPINKHKKRRMVKQGKYMAQTPLVKGYRLTPAVLRTYQQLLKEGTPILYGKNVLVIDVSNDGYLPSAFTLDRKLCWHTFRGEFVITPMAALWMDRELDDDTVGMLESTATMEVASKFGHYEISVQIFQNSTISTETELFENLVCVLQPLFLNSNLHVNMGPSKERNSEPDTRHALEIAQAFKALRCQNFSIVGIGNRNAEKFVQIITGTVDLSEPLWEMYSIEERMMLDRISGRRELCARYRRLRIAARDADTVQFRQLSREILSIYKGVISTFENMLNELQI